MNERKTDSDLLRRAILAVSAEVKGLHFDTLPHLGPTPLHDAGLTVCTGSGTSRFIVEIKRGTLTSAALPVLETLARKAGPDGSLLVAADQIGPSMARQLCDRKIAFMDTAGNAFLASPGFHVWIVGKRTGVKRVVTGLHRQSAVRVIFSLLADPALDQNPGESLLRSSVRIVAKAAGVAVGSVGSVFDNLRSMGFLLEDGDSRQLVERQRLVELWATDYLARLRHRLIHHRYHIASIRDWNRLSPLPPGAWWGGEAAGARLTGHLRPGKITIYADALADAWVVRAGLQPDPKGNVEVLTPFWGEELISRWRHDQIFQPLACVHPLLVYADLLANDEERSSETARRLYDTFLRKLTTSD
jgi:hypothetical protein